MRVPRLILPWALLAGCCLAAGGATARPNILFAIADDASWWTMGAYGCTWVRTPGFDRVAREGLLFTRAYTPNAKCAPSRACILTGRNSWQLEAACNHVPFFPPQFKTYAEALAEHGWFVGKTAKGWAPGVARDAEGRPRHLAGTPFDRRRLTPPARGISSEDYAANFRDFLDAVPPGKPWCFWYGAREPHRGYEYGSGVAKGGKRLDAIQRVPAMWPDNPVIRNDLLDYAFEIEHFDRHLVLMLEELERRGQLDNTLVVVTADNGMPFPRIKGQEYDDSNHLPLAVMWKQGIRRPGRVIDDLVNFIDFAPTFIEVAGLSWEQTGMAPAAGRSLTPYFRDERSGRLDPQRDHVLIGKERHDVGRPHDQGYPIRGIVTDRWLYLRNFEPSRWPAGNPETGYLNCDGSPTKTEILARNRLAPADAFWRLCFGKRPGEELYDLAEDPDCVHNLAADPAHARVKSRLEQQMLAELRRQGDPRVLGRPDYFERMPYAAESHRGFYEKYMAGQELNAGWVNPSDFEPIPLDDEGRPVRR
ncbi:MAG: heparan N-sulfatase [Verrucomicrobia bacterium]|nr:MAG: heparan N-sulfatase [Verrucomicrobiota bacterium]